MRHMSLREIRKHAEMLRGEWTAVEVAPSGYKLRCGDVELSTINERHARVFRTLDGLKSTLRNEFGVTRFVVQVGS